MHTQKNTKISKGRWETKIMTSSKLVAYRDFKSTFPIIYTIYKKLHKKHMTKKFADADTCADNASLVIKCWKTIIYVKSVRTEWNVEID